MVKAKKFTTEQVQAALAEIVEHFEPHLNGGTKLAFWTEIAAKLNQADGSASWTWRYPQGVLAGSIQPSPAFGRAVMAMVISLDDVPIELARAEQVSVLAEPGDIRPGSLVMGSSRTCARPGCVVVFVSNHPSRKYCPVCSPPRKRG